MISVRSVWENELLGYCGGFVVFHPDRQLALFVCGGLYR